MAINIEYIRVEKLFGENSYELKFMDNNLILLAPNGVGKTTILNIIYYLLAKNWKELFELPFEKIEFKINDNLNEIIKTEFVSYNPEEQNIKKILQEDSFKIYSEILSEIYKKIGFSKLNEDIAITYRTPKNSSKTKDNTELDVNYSNADIDEDTLNKFIEKINAARFETLEKKFQFECKAIFLPTFRRTERGINHVLKQIYGSLDNEYFLPSRIEDGKSFISVGFEMEDIARKIQSLLKEKKDFGRINKYFGKCNWYFDKQKEIKISKDEKDYEIKLEKGTHIRLDDLSSGEKQILTILSYIYLEDNADNTILLIDEPEISLSVFWQEQILLDIIESDCSGLIAVTHSPYPIQKGKVDMYTFGLEKFKEE
ncbi:MAG: ATP-binding protein [Leptospiraceae bacterium]|nr:ATP-binding protein [Leptospiraceae bacterium]